MEIRKDNKIIITGNKVCMIAGIITALCACYWIFQAVFKGETDILQMIGTILLTIYFFYLGPKWRKSKE